MSWQRSPELMVRVEIEQAIARGARPSAIMARFGLTYGEYRDVVDAMLDGYDHGRLAVQARRAREREADPARLLRALERERSIVAGNAKRYRARRTADGRMNAVWNPPGRPGTGAA